jgi:hypothetical protein
VVDCPFRIWKDKSQRYVDRRSVEELLRDGRSRPLDGFLDRQGRTFRGILSLVEGRVELERLDGDQDSVQQTPEYEVVDTPLGACPTCHAGEVVETRSTFLCTQGQAVLRKLERDETQTTPVKKQDVPEGMEYCAFVLPRASCRGPRRPTWSRRARPRSSPTSSPAGVGRSRRPSR